MDLKQHHDDATARLAAGPAPSAMPYVDPYTPVDVGPEAGELKIAYAFVDYGDQQWRTIRNGFALAVQTVYPKARVANMPFECDRKDFTKAYLQTYSKMRRSVRGNIMFLDTDVVALRDASHVFDEDFDIGLTDSEITYPLMPFNAGVVFAKDTPGAQLFMDHVMEFANQQPDETYWYLNQIGMYAAYLTLKDRVKFRIFPSRQYNFSPDVVQDTDSYFVHLKGPRKHMFVDYLRQSMELHGNLAAMALPAKELTMGEPTPDPVGLAEIKWPIRQNLNLKLPSYAPREQVGKKVAIVGYGPSLADTWEQLKYFDGEIWTVSKAHDFLVGRGIVPHTHVELDYREHKAYFNKLPSPTTRYVLATQCHPKYLELLQKRGGRIELYHSNIPGGQPSPGYRKVSPQFDAGLQAAYMAFREGMPAQTWFGMDASSRGRQTHAGEHGGAPPTYADIIVAGRHFVSTSMQLRQAMFAERMLAHFPAMKITITGDGALRPFLQERGRVKVR